MTSVQDANPGNLYVPTIREHSRRDFAAEVKEALEPVGRAIAAQLDGVRYLFPALNPTAEIRVSEVIWQVRTYGIPKTTHVYSVLYVPGDVTLVAHTSKRQQTPDYQYLYRNAAGDVADAPINWSSDIERLRQKYDAIAPVALPDDSAVLTTFTNNFAGKMEAKASYIRVFRIPGEHAEGLVADLPEPRDRFHTTSKSSEGWQPAMDN